MRILGISGSLRRASYNRGLLGAAGGLAPAGTTIASGALTDERTREQVKALVAALVAWTERVTPRA